MHRSSYNHRHLLQQQLLQHPHLQQLYTQSGKYGSIHDLNKLDNIFLTFQIACTIQDINVEHSNPLIAVVVEVAVAVLKCPVKTILARITIIIIRA